MGEVWRARDERLGRDVAIKVLPVEFAAEPERLARFEREARATAALSHPNVLAIFDVGVHEGSPYLVEELLEGESLRVRLLDGPLLIREALSLGVQIARGLAAAHDKRIVHRDLKPDNVVVTPDGVPKILDFGLAKIVEPVSGEADTVTGVGPSATEAGRVLGSAAYMAPEQARGLAVDHRADLFAFGVLLHELLSGQRPFHGQTLSDTVAAILKDEPEPLPEVIAAPIRALVRRCLEKRPEDRFSSARDIAFALQALIEGAPRTAARLPEEERPYPGLSAYSEADAKRFFGRDEEIAALWRKLPGRSLLALIGPSGVGKTSFIRAGLVPHAPPGWRCIVATPGQAPFAALARALAPFFSGDAEAFAQLLEFHDPDTAVRLVGRWRQRSDHGLIVVDQFEELFTLNGEDVQKRFAELLGSLAAIDGVHVLLSMRDDFFFACNRFVPLAAVFESVTPLGPPSPAGLRSALVEPAKAMGFAFEDDALVDEMVHAVEGERGALPLLAFAAASLWERRDQESKKLTRSAYDAIAGVAGALAQHAEATLERLGAEKAFLVREIFRNLTTSQQTRCVLDVEELLTVFPEAERGDARAALARLVDARLLTAFEVESPDGSRHDRVEIVHESLLTAWPRLVRWRTEDESGAQLRDQLRQAAHLWREKGEPEDLLWAGTTYREFAVWRERYPGGLSEVEESFSRAMTALAGRRRRRRRVAYAVVLGAVLVTAAALGVLLRRSVSETRRREAGQLLALGRVKLGDSPNAALAFATASLERADNAPARRFAVDVLWRGPTALYLKGPVGLWDLQWSPDGRWLALGSERGLSLLERGVVGTRQLTSASQWVVGFTPDSRRLVATRSPTEREVWSLPGGTLERIVSLPYRAGFWLVGDRLLTVPRSALAARVEQPVPVRLLALDGAPERDLGQWMPAGPVAPLRVDPTGAWMAWIAEGQVLTQRLDSLAAPPRVLGRHEGNALVWPGPCRGRATTGDELGLVRIWDLATGRELRALRSPADARGAVLDPGGRLLAAAPHDEMLSPRSMFLFDLAAPRMAEPVPLLETDVAAYINSLRFSPDGTWLAGLHYGTAVLWNTTGTRSLVLGRGSPAVARFAGDGQVLAGGLDGVLRRWPLDPDVSDGVTEPWSLAGAQLTEVDVDPAGSFVAVTDDHSNKNVIVPLAGAGGPRWEPSPIEDRELLGANPVWDRTGGRLAMTVYAQGNPEAAGIRVVDTVSGNARTFAHHPEAGEGCEAGSANAQGAPAPVWLPDGRLLSDGSGGLRDWDLAAGTSRQLRPCRAGVIQELRASPDGGAVLRLDSSAQTASLSSLSVFDVASGATREITAHGSLVSCFGLDPTGTILVTGDRDGVVRVGPLGGGEPHLLYGHAGVVTSVAVSPDGRWLVSGGADGTIRLWPMPDLAKPPFHSLPHDELLARLHALTNLRVVRDASTDTGWRLEVGPFPGWAVVPEWQP